MRNPAKYYVLAVATVVFVILSDVRLRGDEEGTASARPRTVHEMILKMGNATEDFKQLKLKLEGEVVGKDLGRMPKEMRIDVRYDKASNQILVVNDSDFEDGSKSRLTTYSDQRRALIWTERTEADALLAAKPALGVQIADPAKTLPNPWRLPVKLAFPALFTDALHGYESFGREYSRSRPLNLKPDPRGLLWFDLRTSPGAGAAMRDEFNRGLKVEAGFAAKGGWLKELVIHFPKPEAVMTLRVVEQATELTEEDRAGFGFPEHVVAEARKTPKPPEMSRRESLGLTPGKGAGEAEVAPAVKPENKSE